MLIQQRTYTVMTLQLGARNVLLSSLRHDEHAKKYKLRSIARSTFAWPAENKPVLVPTRLFDCTTKRPTRQSVTPGKNRTRPRYIALSTYIIPDTFLRG